MAGDIISIVEIAESLGAEFRLEDNGRLLVRRFSLLPGEIQEAVRSRKLELVAYLTQATETGYTSTAAGTPASAQIELFCHLKSWSGDDPKRWQQLHNTLLKVYSPTWECIEARDILVAWTAAHLALASAKQQLKRLADPRRPLTSRENISKRAREADIAFWGRLCQRLSTQIPLALSQDEQATEIFSSLLEKEG